MTTVDKYLGMTIFLLIAPITAIVAPVKIAVGTVIALSVIYIFHIMRKPHRRCRPCGEVFKVSFFCVVKAHLGLLKCPRCHSQVKNKHR